MGIQLLLDGWLLPPHSVEIFFHTDGRSHLTRTPPELPRTGKIDGRELVRLIYLLVYQDFGTIDFMIG